MNTNAAVVALSANDILGMSSPCCEKYTTSQVGSRQLRRRCSRHRLLGSTRPARGGVCVGRRRYGRRDRKCCGAAPTLTEQNRAGFPRISRSADDIADTRWLGQLSE
jgi:hypothetical protein